MKDYMNVILRPYDKVLDYGFIISTWPKAVYNWKKNENKVDSVWFKDKFNDVNTQLERQSPRVAVDPEDPTFIFGYSVSNYDFVKMHRSVKFVFVKSAYRNQGIGNLLCGPEKDHSYDWADWTQLGHLIIDTRTAKALKEIQDDLKEESNDNPIEEVV